MAELTSTVVKFVEQSFLSFERKGSHVYLGGQIRRGGGGGGGGTMPHITGGKIKGGALNIDLLSNH